MARSGAIVRALALACLAAFAAATGAVAAPRSVRVSVVGPDGKPPATVHIRATYSGGIAEADAKDGRGTLHLREDVEATLEAYAARGRDGKPLPFANARQALPAGAEVADLRLAKGVEITGRVIDGEGKPVKDATVVATSPSRHGVVAPEYAVAVTDRSGQFRLVGLADEDYALLVREAPPFAASPRSAARGGARDASIRIRKATAVTLRVADPAGKPVGGAEVVVMERLPDDPDKSHSVFYGTTGKDGRVEVPPLDPRLLLSLHVEPPSTRADLTGVVLDPWTAAVLDVEVPPGFTARITVRDEDGKPLVASVEQRIPPDSSRASGGWVVPRTTDTEGRLNVPRLPAKGVRLRATMGEGGKDFAFPAGTPWQTATAEKPQVDFVIHRRGVAMQIRTEGPPAARPGILRAEFGDDASFDAIRGFKTSEEGVAILPKVAPGSYAIFVFGARGGDGLAGRLDRLAFTGAEVAVPLVPGAKVRVRVKAPEGTTKLQAALLLSTTGPLDLADLGDGVFEAEGLPPGEYPVVAFGTRDDEVLRADGKAKAGGDPVELTLARDRLTPGVPGGK